MRRAPALLLVLAVAGCGNNFRVTETVAAREARASLAHAGDVPRGLSFPPRGTRACRLRRIRAECTTATRRAQVGAVVVSFTVAWDRRQHSWTYTVPPGDTGGPRGPAESGDALPR